VGAHNFSDFDTAYSKQVDYIPGAPTNFTFRLPAAIIGNIDLHLLGGFYVNAAVKAPFEGFKKETDAFVSANRWVAVTPRFESRIFGLYVPVVHTFRRTYIGATLRLGPLFLGSTNLSEMLSNKTAYEGDFHAGFRIPVGFGKPSRLSKYAESVLMGKQEEASGKPSLQQQIDSLGREIYVLQSMLKDTTRLKGVQIYINNDGVTSMVERSSGDSLVIRNRQNDQQRRAQEAYANQQQATTDTLLRMLAIKNLELEELKKEQGNNKTGTRRSKAKKGENQQTRVVATNDNEGVEREIARLRRQMAVQNTALVAGGTAAVVVATSDRKDDDKAVSREPISTWQEDSLHMAAHTMPDSVQPAVPAMPDSLQPVVPVKPDTVFIRDTVVVEKAGAHGGYKPVSGQSFDPILFDVNSSAVKAVDRKRLEELASTAVQHPNWKLEVTGMTDARGSVAANRKVATARYTAVRNILLKNGVKDSQIIVGSKLGPSYSNQGGDNPRRVEIRVLED
jgi:outer membrane protein OmpA-like peptidoglycan-associated protein